MSSIDKGSKLTAFVAVMVCVISMGWSIYFHYLYDEERKARELVSIKLHHAEAKLSLIKARNEDLTRELTEAEKIASKLVEERESAEERLQAAREKIIVLEDDLEEAKVGLAAAAKLPERLVQATTEKADIEKELNKVRQDKLKLEMELQKRTGSIPGAVDVGEVKVKTGRRFSGKILVVNDEYEFVVIDLGRDQGMESGVVLILHRGKKFLGKVVVEKVYDRMSAATLVPEWMQGDPQVGDGVKKF